MENLESPITQGVHHVGLSVEDAERAAGFFVEALGFRVAARRPESRAVFVTDDQVLLTLWTLRDDAPPADFDRHRHVGLHHLALRVPTESVLHAAVERLSAREDVTVERECTPVSEGSSARHAFFAGPSGIRVELVWAP